MTPSNTSSPAPAQIEGAIRNPANASHFMVIRPIPRRIRVFCKDTLLADTNKAVRVLEQGKSLYDPAIYLPESDIITPLTRLEKTSHCPLKGDAAYFAHKGVEIAWSYAAPIVGAEKLGNYFAFWPDKVRIEEGA